VETLSSLSTGRLSKTSDTKVVLTQLEAFLADPIVLIT
jgi:hypothetical protein